MVALVDNDGREIVIQRPGTFGQAGAAARLDGKVLPGLTMKPNSALPVHQGVAVVLSDG